MKKIATYALLVLLALSAYAGVRLWIGSQGDVLVSTQGHISCSQTEYSKYTDIMLEAGEMTISKQPSSGDREQQLTLINSFESLKLPRNKTAVTVGHFPTGKIYTNICKNEKCSLEEIATPEQECLTEHWNDCPYVAIKFRENNYCLLEVEREK
ncbi:hypothetical protein [Paracoccus saliphilus]|uniref:Uncharacterized protein n=1 Tax=Paracoccus saliphilus TaxID=405559 RepID=A0ABY7S4Q8_9RHOB|nr:hypothetical protein [Paracoccus saliphilus]WCR02057.1 hypothetical protein JHX88_14220 [Paracoccus saliphilus]